MKKTTAPFDIAAHLDSDAVIAAYLETAADDPNPDVFLSALGHVAKARGIADIAKRTGLGRESLCKSLGAGAKPRYETIRAILNAMGLEFRIA